MNQGHVAHNIAHFLVLKYVELLLVLVMKLIGALATLQNVWVSDVIFFIVCFNLTCEDSVVAPGLPCNPELCLVYFTV